MRIASTLWSIFFIALLGWYGFAMVGIGAVIYIAIAAIIEKRKEKERMQSGDWPNNHYRQRKPKKPKGQKATNR